MPAVDFPVALATFTVIFSLILLCIAKSVRASSRLRHIPTVGSGLLSSLTGYQSIFKGRDLLQEGYKKVSE
jgi:hypothetical protein